MTLIGIDIGAGHIRGARLTKSGIITKHTYILLHPKDNAQEVLIKLFEVIDKLITSRIEFIGVGVPGLVSAKGNVLELRNIDAWHNVSLKQILEKKYKKQVFIDNDANCFVLGEKYFGKAKKYNNVVGVIIGSGAGAGVLIKGKLYDGLDSGAGQFGDIKFNHKTVEDYCSGKLFLWKYHLTGVQMYNKVIKSNHVALDAFDKFGEYVAEELAIIMKSIAPEMIILGGSVAKAFCFFKHSMFKTLKERIPKHQFKLLKIKESTLRNAGILGAAMLYKEHLRR